jgi:predicted small secreted protein
MEKTMKLYLVPASLVVTAALLAGCAQTHSSEMGAGPSPSTGTLCKDGTMQPPNSACAQHGGVSGSGSSGSSSPRQSTY